MRHWLVIFGVFAPGTALAQRWEDRTAQCIGTTAEWTNKAEVADLDGDGHVDLLLANGGNYSSGGTPQASRIWKNLANWTTGSAHCMEITSSVLGSFTGSSRFIKAADVNGDGKLDVLTGGAWGSQLKLFVQGSTGAFTDASTQLPQQNTAAGDAEFGDVDGDGDLDIVISEWGAGNPGTNAGGRTRLYRNNGSGTFTDETSQSMPNILVRWSWDLELADVDNDWDLDVLVSCKACTTSYLFRNDGTGSFTDDANALPHFTNNYEFEPFDIDNDNDLDLVTVNDGPSVTEHIFVNDGTGTYADETSTRLAGSANPADVDDNAAVWIDVDNDGDADLLFATLGPDRLLINNGGVFTADTVGATPDDTNASLGLAVADFDDDTRPDLLQGQGEVMNSMADKVQIGGTQVSFDTQPPRIRAGIHDDSFYARVHDFIGPSHPHDFKSVVVRINGTDTPMTWIGEQLWRAPGAVAGTVFEVCATDRAGNEKCVSSAGGDDAGVGGDTSMPPGDNGGGGGCCDTRGDPRGTLLLVLLVAGVSARSRSRYRRSRSGSRHRTSP